MNKYIKKDASESMKNSILEESDDSDFSSEENHNFFLRNYKKNSNCTSGRKLTKDRTSKLIDIASLSLERSEYMIIRWLEEKYKQKNLYNSTSGNSMPSINIVCYYPSSLPPIQSLQTSPNNIQPPILSQQRQTIPYYSCTYLPNQMPPIPAHPILPFNQPVMPFPFASISTKKRHKKFIKNDQHKHKKTKQKKTKKEEKKEKKEKKEKEDKKKNEKDDKEIIKEFKFKGGQEFEGIFNYLYTKTNGNIHDNGTIEITASSQFRSLGGFGGGGLGSESFHPKALLNGKDGSRGSIRSSEPFDRPNYYRAARNDNTFWVRFDFKKMNVSITSYVIQNTRYAFASNIRNWVIEISDDGDKWDQIDSQNDCLIFKRSSTTHNFEVKETKFVRYVRFRHTGNIWSGNSPFNNAQCICIQAMEFFGKLKE